MYFLFIVLQVRPLMKKIYFLQNFKNLIADICSRDSHFIPWYFIEQLTIEGTQLESLFSLYGVKKVILEPTNILQNPSSFIDLIYTKQPNLIMNSWVHPTLHSKCHHQIIYPVPNLKLEHPPPYAVEVWGIMKKCNFVWLIAQLKTSIEMNFLVAIILIIKSASLIGQY